MLSGRFLSYLKKRKIIQNVTRCHSLSFVVTRFTISCHSLSLVVIRCHSLYHLLSPVVTRCTTRLLFYKRSLLLRRWLLINIEYVFRIILYCSTFIRENKRFDKNIIYFVNIFLFWLKLKVHRFCNGILRKLKRY